MGFGGLPPHSPIQMWCLCALPSPPPALRFLLLCDPQAVYVGLGPGKRQGWRQIGLGGRGGESFEPPFQPPPPHFSDGPTGEGVLRDPNIYSSKRRPQCADHFEVFIMRRIFLVEKIFLGRFAAPVVSHHQCLDWRLWIGLSREPLFQSPPPPACQFSTTPTFLLKKHMKINSSGLQSQERWCYTDKHAVCETHEPEFVGRIARVSHSYACEILLPLAKHLPSRGEPATYWHVT